MGLVRNGFPGAGSPGQHQIGPVIVVIVVIAEAIALTAGLPGTGRRHSLTHGLVFCRCARPSESIVYAWCFGIRLRERRRAMA